MSILGPSGGGKTTLLNIILGITTPPAVRSSGVALARTLVMKPRLLLLDEPLSALDGVIKESIKAKIKQIVDQYNLTTIMVTHDPEEACTMSDRVLILNQGRIAQYDTPENIIEHPASDFVRDFILHQLEVKRNNIYSLFSEDHAADPAGPPPAANRRSSAPERSDPTMSVESIQAGKQLPNIAPEIINHERRPSKPKQTELWVLLAVVAVAFCSHFEPKLLSILDRFADPKPGVIDAVAALREAGLKIGSTTGYTDAMMEIVVPKAAELGYAPDHWVSADGTQGFVRPYPYMIFHNMQVLRLMDVRRVAKVVRHDPISRRARTPGCSPSA